MTVTLGKAFCFAFLLVLALSAAIAVYYVIKDKLGTQNEATTISTKETEIARIYTVNNGQEVKSENHDYFYSEEGYSYKILIEQNCVSSSRDKCLILNNKLTTELKTWIKENELAECAIVKYAENNCTETNTLECDKDFCSVPKDQESTTDPSKLGFWLQNYFQVTSFKLKSVKTSAHLKRFKCIKPDETEGVEVEGICIRNLNPSDLLSSDVLQFEFVKKYLAKNLKNYTQLPIEVAELIDYDNLPDGTQIYYKNGDEVDDVPYSHVYVLPSKPTVTKETVSWMRYDKNISRPICNLFGLRILTSEEIKALPQKDLHVNCFFDNEGKKLTELKSTVWAFGEDVGTYRNHIEVTNDEKFMFATKVRDVLFLKDTESIKVSDDFVVIHKNVILKKSADHVIYSPYNTCAEFKEHEGFKKFTKDDFVIIYCMLGGSFCFGIICLYPEEKQLPASFNYNLMKSKVGQRCFVRYGTIEDKTHLHLINMQACQDSLNYRISTKPPVSDLKCVVEDEKTFIVIE